MSELGHNTALLLERLCDVADMLTHATCLDGVAADARRIRLLGLLVAVQLVEVLIEAHGIEGTDALIRAAATRANDELQAGPKEPGGGENGNGNGNSAAA